MPKQATKKSAKKTSTKKTATKKTRARSRPPPRPPTSCYILELSVQPGGARWAELHVYTDPAHLRPFIEMFCAMPARMYAYFAVWYGATLGVWVVQAGEVERFIDLHRYILISRGAHAPIPLADKDLVETMLLAGKRRSDRLIGRSAFFDGVELTLAWDELAAVLPPLRPPLLAPGDATPVSGHERFDDDNYLPRVAQFGSREVEGGEPIPIPFDIPGYVPTTDE
jgi:hypothetical protein